MPATWGRFLIRRQNPVPVLSSIAILLACYAFGCASLSYYAVKWRTGKDLRESGSGNVGSTNAGRLLGKKAFLILTVADIAKGWATLVFAAWCGLADWWLCAAGMAVVAGHLWPVQLGFRGGKGMSTSHGAIIYAAPWVALAMWGIFAAGKLLLRSSTLGAVCAFFAAPLLMLAWHPAAPSLVMVTVLCVAVILCHRPNIRDALQRRRDRGAQITESTAA